MSVKLRLARKGRKKLPFFHIVAADSRSSRDGKYIEVIGSYDPKTIPASIEIDREKALNWLNKGAIPTETTQAILRYTGVLFKKHLLQGVKKGKINEEQATQKINEWDEKHASYISGRIADSVKEKTENIKTKISEETRKKEDKAIKILAKRNAEMARLAAAQAPKAEVETAPDEQV